MTIPDLSELQAEVNVPESGIRRIQLDQKAVITIEALAGKTFKGTVRNVAEVANAVHWRTADVKEFKVALSMEQTPGLKPGFSCHAEIVTKEIENALQVPIQAVFRDGQTYYVYPVEGGPDARHEIEIGEASVSHVQVTRGLKPGESVYLSDPATGDPRS